MFRSICQISTLRDAWQRVRSNGAARGGDGETLEQFERALDRRLADLAHGLQTRAYRPGPLREVALPKPDGRIRILRIPGLADRVVQTACLRVMSAGLDARMCTNSFGYRPARSVGQALDRFHALARHSAWVLDADIETFFDRVPHATLLDELGIWIDDTPVLWLIGLWLASFGKGIGLAQGAPISPLLANLALHPLDMAFVRNRIAFVRYADDFVALGASYKEALAARTVAAETLARRGLQLNAAKTRIVAPGKPFCFLGTEICTGLGLAKSDPKGAGGWKALT